MDGYLDGIAAVLRKGVAEIRKAMDGKAFVELSVPHGGFNIKGVFIDTHDQVVCRVMTDAGNLRTMGFNQFLDPAMVIYKVMKGMK
jgi:hypothetical protein